jgi:hypothetical protein
MAKKSLFLLAAALVLGAAAPKAGPLDAIARAYVHLTLEAGEHEPGYVDAYYGPAAWADAAKASPRSVAQLRGDAHVLRLRAEHVSARNLTPIERERRAFLIGQLKAAEMRLAMQAGEHFSFADEAEGLFGVRPKLPPLASLDTTLAEIDTLVPGEGPLWQRVDNYKSRFAIAPDKLDRVMRAGMAECRKRTLAHIPLPASEHFQLEFVTHKPWSGYNYYKGHSNSLIQVNTDLPVLIDRATLLGCHEGYPGHHVYNMLLEQELVRKRGWVEFTVYPLYSPQSLIAEGSAEYGVDLAFPGEELAAFAAQVLYPLAGLDPAEAKRFNALQHALEKLGPAFSIITSDYVDGRITRSEAVALTQKYSLLSEPRADKQVEYGQNYRSYVINYGLGQDMVREDVEAAGADAGARWRVMRGILSRPTTPQDLRRASAQ